MPIHEKMLEIRRHVGPLSKDERNEHQGFNYVSSVKVLEAVREKMNELGILIFPRIGNVRISDRGKQILTEIWVDYKWYDTESKESIDVEWYAQGLDIGEKGVGKALTYGEKFLVLKTFNIPTPQHDPDSLPSPRPETPKTTSRTKTASVSLADSEPEPEADSTKIEKIKEILTSYGFTDADAARYLCTVHDMVSVVDGNPDLTTLSDDDADLVLNNEEAFVNGLREFLEPPVKEI